MPCTRSIFFLLALSLNTAHLEVRAAEAGSALPAAAATALVENLWSVKINGEDQHETALFLRDSGGKVLAAAKDLQRWHFHLPAAEPLKNQDEAFYPLDELGGVSYQVEESTQTLAMTAPGNAFTSSTVSGATDSPTPVPSTLGGFLNYDGFASYSQGIVQMNALTETGIFNRWGVGTSSILWKNLTQTMNMVRLDNTWTKDMPASMSSLRFGDAISQPGEWGGAVWRHSMGHQFYHATALCSLPHAGCRGRGDIAVHG